jgi:hypothetical protein
MCDLSRHMDAETMYYIFHYLVDRFLWILFLFCAGIYNVLQIYT